MNEYNATPSAMTAPDSPNRSVASAGSGHPPNPGSPSQPTYEVTGVGDATTFLNAAVKAVTTDTINAVSSMWEKEQQFHDKLYLPTAVLLITGIGMLTVPLSIQPFHASYKPVEFVGILVIGFLMMVLGSALRLYQYRSERGFAEGIQKAAEKSVESASHFRAASGPLKVDK